MPDTLASILGQSKFDIDAPSGSVPIGSESATRSDDNGVNGNARGNVTDDISGGSVDASRRAVNPESATASANEPASSGTGNGNSRSSSRKRSASSRTDTRARKESDEGEIHLDALLSSVHKILAKVIAAPELELDDDEAKALAGAIKRVTKYITKKVLSPQQEAVGALFITAAAIYIPRYMIYSARTGGPIVDMKPQVQTVNVKVG